MPLDKRPADASRKPSRKPPPAVAAAAAVEDPARHARQIGLTYYPDDRPGITRRRCGRGFSYRAPDGTTIADRAKRTWIESLAVPPAYEQVWITPKRNGHLQATGRDARGRKQYRYHEDWAGLRAERKFEGLAGFGRALPRLRARIAAGLGAPPGSRDIALAAVLALLDRAAIRVGSPIYARENESFGATTLLGKHIRFDGDEVALDFPGKRGQPVTCKLRGRRLQSALHKIHDLPGAELISWCDEDGEIRTIRSDTVNEELDRLCGPGATAKTFRTWAGTHAAFCAALTATPLRIADMAEAAAERLTNTPTIARNNYIHPRVIGLAEMADDDRRAFLDSLEPPVTHGLRAHEGKLLALLERDSDGS